MRPIGLDQRRRRLRPWLTAVGMCLVAFSGCARSRPATTPVAVALDVPPPPARVIPTPPEPVAPTETMTTERPAPTTRPARAVRSSSRPEPVRTEPARVEPPTDTPPVAAPAEPATNTGPLLRTPQTADEINAEKRTRDVLGRATTLLDSVKAATLGQQARQQHETARRFIAQAQQAIVDRNFVLASYLADKAETLAKGLSR